VAIATAVVLIAICTAVFGVGVWPAFLGGMNETGRELLEGRWSPTMMTSVFAAAVANGVSLEVARYVQIAVSIIVLGWIFLISRRATLADAAGFALVAATLVSPFFSITTSCSPAWEWRFCCRR
jgi:hypothetical protein